MPGFRTGPAHVRVPATSANLGPGFDALGLALSLHDDVVARVVASGLCVEVEGEGVDRLPRTEQHLVVRAMRAAFEVLGGQPPGLRVSCRNRVPHDRGLGSSAAAIVSGLVAARALVADGDRMFDDAALLVLATELEGHPDNVAACLLGGLTVAWQEADGARAVSMRPVDTLRPVALVPDTRSSTVTARGALPDTVPHADAAWNAGRAALLVHALTRDPRLLLSATGDRLHQPYRAPGIPASAQLVHGLRLDRIPAVVSGAGPTVLAFPEPGVDLSRHIGPGWKVLQLTVDNRGAVLLPSVK